MNLNVGYGIALSSFLLLLVGSYSTLFSAFYPETGIWVSEHHHASFVDVLNFVFGIKFFDILAQDTHYKYWFIMLIPTTTYFVIANWVGWQYYRNS